MVRMVRVFEALPPDSGYSAEVPGRPGLVVRAESLPEIRAKLRAVLADPAGARFASSCWPNPSDGYSDTALFISI